jgi:LEA14-like dessication related protein
MPGKGGFVSGQMKKWIFLSILIVVIAVVLLIVLLGLDELRLPELRNVSLEWGEVTSATTEVLGILTIYNPNSVSLPIEGITGDIKMDDIKVGSAETIDLQIVKETEFPIKVVAKIDNGKMPEFWAEHLRRDEKSVAEIEMRIAFDLEGVKFTIPYTIKQPIETDILSYLSEIEPISVEEKVDIPILGEKTAFKFSLNRISGTWGTATPQASEIELIASVYNDNLYPLLIPKIECFVESNGMHIGYGETGLINAMLPKSEKDIEIAATIDTSLMNEWFVRHIQQGEKSTFGIRILMTFGLPEEVLEMIGLEDLSITLWEDT